MRDRTSSTVALLKSSGGTCQRWWCREKVIAWDFYGWKLTRHVDPRTASAGPRLFERSHSAQQWTQQTGVLFLRSVSVAVLVVSIALPVVSPALPVVSPAYLSLAAAHSSATYYFFSLLQATLPVDLREWIEEKRSKRVMLTLPSEEGLGSSCSSLAVMQMYYDSLRLSACMTP